ADLYIIATGPLTSPQLLASISTDNHYFYDAIAPIVSAEGLDPTKLFWADRYEKGQPDFLNCALTRQEYDRFVDALLAADKLPYADHERPQFFDRCMPIETMAERGRNTLSFGPFRPVGFEVEGQRPYAVVQLRAENADKSAFNLVGCQTRMRHHAQREVFRLLPGLENAEFLRFGSVHRNSYINAPELLADGLNLLKHPDTYVAGQLSGVEGYNESIFSGLYTALTIIARFEEKKLPPPPAATMSGGLLRKLRAPAGRFAPVNANFSIIDNPTRLRKRDRKLFHVADGVRQFREWWAGVEKGTQAT
ncbi:MAG TPA: methylenetetrahydrofolate--tRNA-(uracil(54)-C(5))-methyltransferase (FADH(2)-oxidizing) TrmFO, partial [bacterium]|nr:methylenetetrahydrofolate--tRNA-(uracil(54)-C(5))-methyltransferase (FADH(2)-oxidizing) TrmFO [bacterium]